MIFYDIETLSGDKVAPNKVCLYKLGKISSKYHQDITEKEYQKYLDDCVVFKGTNSIIEMLDFVFRFKGEHKKLKNEFVEKKLYLLAHKGTGFDSYVVLNSLPQ